MNNPTPYTLDSTTLIQQRDAAIGQLRFAREYTLSMLVDIDSKDWYVVPEGFKTHLAWQVGHLAVAEYGLMLFRQRGRTHDDLDLMPGWFRKSFSRGTTPQIGTADSMDSGELLAALSKIHDKVLEEAIQFDADLIGQPTEMPYAVHPLKVGAMLFCPLHESIHAGQIGLLRRALGLNSLR